MRTAWKPVAIVVLGLLVTLALAQTNAPGVHAAFTDADGDGAIDLAEEVFGSDAQSTASVPETAGFPLLVRTDVCHDNVDNDLDGSMDGADPGCADSDDDLFSDQIEQQLGGDPDSADYFPEDSRLDNVLIGLGVPVQLCANGNDDDDDGLEDAADPGCTDIDSDSDSFTDLVEKNAGSDMSDAGSVPEHETFNPGSCSDNTDNDLDGAVDPVDDGCVALPNDDIGDALLIDSLPFAHTAKAFGATSEPGEPQASCIFVEDETERSTVWYRFAPPKDTHVIIDTDGSDLVAGVSVWRDGPSGFTEVDCSVNFFFFPGRSSFAANGGETYFIQLDRYVLEPEEFPGLIDLGRLSFHAEATEPPANDDFADAQPVTSLPFAASADTIAASVEPSEPEASCRYQGYPAGSVWYRYTPAVDTYVQASAFPGSDFGVTIGVYEGTSLSALEQIACGDEALAFKADAGHTYYLQAAGYTCQFPGEDGGEAASFCFDSRGGELELSVESFELPGCPSPKFTFADPVGDADDTNFPLDLTSVSIGWNHDVACITARLDPPVQPEDLGAWLELDADLAGPVVHGISHISTACDYPTGIGFDHRLFVDYANEGLLSNVVEFEINGPRIEHPAYFAYDGSLATIILPLSSIGGDANFRFAIEMSHFDTYDCAPDGGNIRCESGNCAFVPFRNGDANCVSGANALDAAIVLQYGAGLLSTLPCPDAADVDGNGVIDSPDAALILQYSASLLDQLPPIPCPKPPEFC